MRQGNSRSPQRTIGGTLVAVGVVGLVISSVWMFDLWFQRQAWYESEERNRAQRLLDVNFLTSSEGSTEPSAESRSAVVVPVSGRGSVPAAQRIGTPTPPNQGRLPQPVSIGASASELRPPIVADISSLDLVASSIFVPELPKPGAPAVLRVTVKNRARSPSAPIPVGVSADWFDNYEVVGAVPSVLADRTGEDGFRYFEFPGAAPGAEVTLELHVTTLGATARTPTLKVPMYLRSSLSQVRPTFSVGDFSLGPAQGVSFPRLGIRTAVVGTSWEPPSFVAGQIDTSASLGEGNVVLIGHRGGNAGDVFQKLLVARLGDEVVAASHGIEQRYIVSEIRRLPGTDISPMRDTATPRLTLMTCTGAWNPLTGDYSHRHWVVAEPVELARATLASAVERANEEAATAINRSEQLRARTDAALARSALSLIDARSRRGQ